MHKKYSVNEDVVLEFALKGVDEKLLPTTGPVPMTMVAGLKGQTQNNVASIAWITESTDVSFARFNARAIFRPNTAGTWTWKATITGAWQEILEGEIAAV